MAEQKQAPRNGSSGAARKGGSSGGGRRAGSTSSKLSAADAIERVREELPALLGRSVESIVGVERDDDGWVVSAQIVELARIPNSTDVLGVYSVHLDSGGELAGYQRERRYSRGQVIED